MEAPILLLQVLIIHLHHHPRIIIVATTIIINGTLQTSKQAMKKNLGIMLHLLNYYATRNPTRQLVH
jgi:hypothetical protein